MLPIIGVFLSLLLCLATGVPFPRANDLPKPNEGSIFAKLEGMPPCYVGVPPAVDRDDSVLVSVRIDSEADMTQASCMISEKHWDAFNPMRKSSGAWCHLSDYWTSYHYVPCVKKRCDVTKMERKGWFPMLLLLLP